MDPAIHWIDAGYREGRLLAPDLVYHFSPAASACAGASWHRYSWQGGVLSLRSARPGVGTLLARLRGVEPGEDAFVELVFQSIDREFYLAEYPDIAAVGMDPAQHWLEAGYLEGRLLAPNVIVRRGRAVSACHGRGWRRHQWGGELIALRASDQPIGWLAARLPDLDPDDEAFAEYVSRSIDRDFYLTTYPDLAVSGMDPAEHWLRAGFQEGRRFSSDVVVRALDAAEVSPIGLADQRQFHWRGGYVEATRIAVSPQILALVKDQGRHDPAVFAPGPNAIMSLNRFAGPDLMARDRVDPHRLFEAFAPRPDVVILVPFLVPGGAEKYAADIVDVLARELRLNVTVVVTEQTSSAAGDWQSLAILRPLRFASLIFWRDICLAWNPVVTLARLLNVLRPKALFVMNSRLGLDVVARFGRGLSVSTRLYCAYFSISPHALGAPYGARFPRLTAKYAASLSDNKPMTETLRDRYAGLGAHAVEYLPPRVEPTSTKVFERRLQARIDRADSSDHSGRHWLWISRIEEFKGASVLANLAALRPDDVFHVFGPGSSNAGQFGLDRPNVRLGGVLSDVSKLNAARYDGFLFTSRFEGMPNIVLEMAQHAIPMVLSAVGGLRDTFGGDGPRFVELGHDDDSNANLFDEALSRLPSAAVEIERLVRRAYEAVLSRHSPAVHAAAVRDLVLG